MQIDAIQKALQPEPQPGMSEAEQEAALALLKSPDLASRILSDFAACGLVIEYIEASLADIELANRIAHDVLGRSLDELPPQTRRLLALIDGYVGAESQRQGMKRCDVRFTRRALREAIAWGDTQLKIHLARLVELEYLVAYRDNGKGKAGGFEYELVYDLTGDDEALRFPGLADIEALAHAYDGARSGQTDARSGSGRWVVGVAHRLESRTARAFPRNAPTLTEKRTSTGETAKARRIRNCL